VVRVRAVCVQCPECVVVLCSAVQCVCDVVLCDAVRVRRGVRWVMCGGGWCVVGGVRWVVCGCVPWVGAQWVLW
jgi:hypothetical protein